MMCEDSILATTFTTSNLSSPSCSMKQSRTLKVIPFVHTIDDDDEDEDDDDENEDLEELPDADESSRNKYSGALSQQQVRNLNLREQETSSSPSSHALGASSGSLIGGLEHIQQHLNQLNRINYSSERLISSPSSNSCSPSNDGLSKSEARSSSSSSISAAQVALLPGGGYQIPASANHELGSVSLILNSSNLQQRLHPNSTLLLDSTALNELTQTSSDRSNDATHCRFAPISSSPSSSSSAATSPASSAAVGSIMGHQASHAMNADDESRISSSTSSHPNHHQQHGHHHQHHHNTLHNQMHNQNQHQLVHQHGSNVIQQQHIPSGLLSNNNQQDSFHHQLLNHDNHLNHHSSPNSSGSLPPFCTL